MYIHTVHIHFKIAFSKRLIKILPVLHSIFHATKKKWLRGKVEKRLYIGKKNRSREEVRKAESNFERV